MRRDTRLDYDYAGGCRLAWRILTLSGASSHTFLLLLSSGSAGYFKRSSEATIITSIIFICLEIYT